MQLFAAPPPLHDGGGDGALFHRGVQPRHESARGGGFWIFSQFLIFSKNSYFDKSADDFTSSTVQDRGSPGSQILRDWCLVRVNGVYNYFFQGIFLSVNFWSKIFCARNSLLNQWVKNLEC